MNSLDKLISILETEEGFDLPINRVNGLKNSSQSFGCLHWLLRNFSIRNSNHPKHDEVLSLIKQCIIK